MILLFLGTLGLGCGCWFGEDGTEQELGAEDDVVVVVVVANAGGRVVGASWGVIGREVVGGSVGE
ncbi:transcription repressor OFP2-like [Iris pallida]|uniref:Transcription repressor OFP2-like n=1 Tax=Iris pallida TaxID=29817 RepID=A0AAX6HW70_IRIPA|nr:transcription repressor OFP2-like [Iris pallida]